MRSLLPDAVRLTLAKAARYLAQDPGSLKRIETSTVSWLRVNGIRGVTDYKIPRPLIGKPSIQMSPSEWRQSVKNGEPSARVRNPN